ncbi:proline-rich nuclear receptor coactivator motif domain-containing protein [Sarocladium implicatum]|nr:proline-rich nuclear receptor coactivator motif domain-containing protein [Sarocladium implicatum]
MSEVSVPPKATPGRRRNARGHPKPAAKAYASENDATAMNPSAYCASPQTPIKNASAGRNNAPNSQANSKSRTKNNKSKPKHAPPSPDNTVNAQQTTPQRAASMSTSKPSMAFAGATFHASPAPSALPMPSFFTKSSNESPGPRPSTYPTQQPSPPATDTELPTPRRTTSASKSNGSPLDFMFRAHREEKERERRGSTLSQKPSINDTTSPFQSPAARVIPREASSVPPMRNPLIRQPSSGRIDSEELDGEQGLPMGPAFSTPYQDRIRAARSNQTRSTSMQPMSPPQAQKHESLEDQTEALKKFLFGNGGGGFSKASQTNAAGLQSESFSPPRHDHYTTGNFHAAPQQNLSPPVQPAPVAERPTNLQAMENDLRRILKLKPNGRNLF